jgi:hypothetical protein
MCFPLIFHNILWVMRKSGCRMMPAELFDKWGVHEAKINLYKLIAKDFWILSNGKSFDPWARARIW